jgi:hypothetical protein
MGDETGQALLAQGPNIVGAVELMEPGSPQSRGIANIVQVGGRHQETTLRFREYPADFLRSLSDRSGVPPTVAQRGQQPFRDGSCLLKLHGLTIPAPSAAEES